MSLSELGEQLAVLRAKSKQEKKDFRAYAKSYLTARGVEVPGGQGVGTIDLLKKIILRVIYRVNQSTDASTVAIKQRNLNTMVKKADAIYSVYKLFGNGVWTLFTEERAINV
jgi:hypothetical protein